MPERSAETEDTSRRFLLAFGRRLQAARRRKNLTQAQLAKKLGCTSDMVGRYERGQSFPYGLMLVRLAHHLDVTVDYLVTGRNVCGVVDKRLLQRVQALEGAQPEVLDQAIGFLDLLLGKRPS